uniref:Synergin gamma C-terminal domain-containing protein n=1 Tax=Haptolina brevifila TaxID=156173 RepID=A0A7S2CYF5_9EUKA
MAPPAAPLAAPPAPVATLGGEAGGLQSVLEGLLAQERFEEALACKQHVESIAQLSVQKAKYEAAKEDDDLETAIHLKKVVLPQLREQIQPAHVLETWQAPSPGALTLKQMATKAEAVLGAQEAAPYVSRLCSRDLQSLASTSLTDAAREHATASATLELLFELQADAQAGHLKRMDELLAALMAQLEAAAEALMAPRPTGADDEAHAQAMRSTRVTTLLQAVVEMRKVGGRLALAREWFASVFVSSAATKAGKGAADSAQSRARMCELVRKSMAAAGRDPEGEAAEEAEEVEVLRERGPRYWALALPVSKRCQLSLLPLSSEELPELPPTVLWDGRPLHAPYANLWANCVKDALPSF